MRERQASEGFLICRAFIDQRSAQQLWTGVGSDRRDLFGVFLEVALIGRRINAQIAR